MSRAQDGDRDAYRRLLLEIVPYLRKLAARHHRERSDIEDAVQDILLTVHAIRHTYDPNRPFAPWLTTIANRRLIDRLRQNGRLRARETAWQRDHETFTAPEPNLYQAAWDAGALHEAIGSLPKGQRQAVTMLKLQDMSLKEASARTGMSVAALKVATHRAIKSLRRILRKRSGDR